MWHLIAASNIKKRVNIYNSINQFAYGKLRKLWILWKKSIIIKKAENRRNLLGLFGNRRRLFRTFKTRMLIAIFYRKSVNDITFKRLHPIYISCWKKWTALYALHTYCRKMIFAVNHTQKCILKRSFLKKWNQNVKLALKFSRYSIYSIFTHWRKHCEFVSIDRHIIVSQNRKNLNVLFGRWKYAYILESKCKLLISKFGIYLMQDYLIAMQEHFNDMKMYKNMYIFLYF